MKGRIGTPRVNLRSSVNRKALLQNSAAHKSTVRAVEFCNDLLNQDTSWRFGILVLFPVDLYKRLPILQMHTLYDTTPIESKAISRFCDMPGYDWNTGEGEPDPKFYPV